MCMAVVNQAGKIGFINKDNEVVIPFEYTYHQKKLSPIISVMATV